MPHSFQRSAEAVGQFVKELERQNTKYVRFELPDLHGISRCKVVPIQNVAGFAAQASTFMEARWPWTPAHAWCPARVTTSR